jgi:hypothetical protein
LEGGEIWAKPCDYGKFPELGGASSPLLYGNKLIIEVLHGSTTDEAITAALTARRGKPL